MVNFTPASGYIHIEIAEQEEINGNFQWAKQTGDLTAVKVITGVPYSSGDVLIVISTMIQEFEYKKTKIKICPTSAIIGQIVEE